MQIALFSFYGTQSADMLQQVAGEYASFCIQHNDIDDLQTWILEKKPDLILGLGDRTGRDHSQPRIESFCTNKFRNNLIDEKTLIKYPLYAPDNLPRDCRIGQGMGNGHCNHTCYQLLQWIEANKLQTKVMFLHVPKNYDSQRAIIMMSHMVAMCGI